MKTILHHRYGSPDVLEVAEIEKPVPGVHQVLVKVHAVSLNAVDWHALTADVFLFRLMGGGLRRPKDLGLGRDLAGRVEAVGPGVTQFRPGDEVFGAGIGTLAEYACASETFLVRKPAAVSFEAAATVPVAALTALQGLRDAGRIEPGQKVLIQGGSGGVGIFAVQIAKALGAEVTAVCSTRNLEMVRSIGADHVVDYTREDVTRGGRKYDLILAVNGYRSIFDYRRVMSPTGRFIWVGGSAERMLPALFEATVVGRMLSRAGGRQIGFMGVAKIIQKDLTFIGELIEAGKIVSVIDRCYPLDEAAAAFRHFGESHARGKVVVSVVA